jgi:hypothetical protein
MATEVTIAPKTVWEKLLIYWHTKNHTRHMYDVALIIATAIYTNHKIYAEELEEADRILHGYLNDDHSIAEIMEYIQMKVASYVSNEANWYKDIDTCRKMVGKDQQLFTHFLEIFEADHVIDEEEGAFIESIKVMLSRT